MPTTTPFTALGRGNGFPFCLPRVDVDSFDFWTTLGGYNKTHADAGTPVTQEQIDLSLANAMKLFWNFNGVTLDETFVGDSVPSQTIDLDAELYDSASPFPFDPIPSSRVCYNFIGADIMNAVFPHTIFQIKVSIRRMYVAGIFVGYGVRQYTGHDSVLCEAYNSSWGFDLSGAAMSSTSDDTETLNQYVEFFGLPLVASMRAFVSLTDMTIQSTPTTVTGFSGPPWHVNVSTFTFRDLNFYTYP